MSVSRASDFHFEVVNRDSITHARYDRARLSKPYMLLLQSSTSNYAVVKEVLSHEIEGKYYLV